MLNREGEAAIHRITDGARLGGFSTGLAPGATAPGDGPWPEDRPPAAVAGGVLYVVVAGALHGYAVPDGDRVLLAELPGPGATAVVATTLRAASGARSGRAAPATPVLLVSLDADGVAAVDGPTAGSGGVRWTAPTEGALATPVVALPERNLAIAAEANGGLSAFRLEDGRRRWRWSLAEGFDHPPLAQGDRLYAATRANTIYAFDAATGAEQWRAGLPGRAAASPLRLAGALIVATRDGWVLELNPQNGMAMGRPRDLGAEVTGAVASRGDASREQGWRARRLLLGLRDGSLATLGPRLGAASPAPSGNVPPR